MQFITTPEHQVEQFGRQNGHQLRRTGRQRLIRIGTTKQIRETIQDLLALTNTLRHGRKQISSAVLPANSSLGASTYLRKSHLLPLIQRPIEPQQGGADGGGGVAHGGEALAHDVHAAGAGVSAVSAGQAEASVSAALSEAVRSSFSAA